MKLRNRISLAVASALFSVGAHAAANFYNSEAAFLAASSGVSLSFESFEGATLSTPTSVAFAGGAFSCSGSAYCPGFFGISSSYAQTGSKSVYYASPDTATFTFSAPINYFGIHIGGAGDVAPNTLTATLSTGDVGLALNNYTGPYQVFGGNDQYFGVVSSTGFTSITFSASNSGDGIFFDSMSIAAVPEPETYAMLLAGLGILGGVARRRSRA